MPNEVRYQTSSGVSVAMPGAASPACRPFASAKPEPSAAIRAGTSNRKPHGIAVLTNITIAWDANSSVSAVESQKVAMATIATAPATGWIILVMVLLSHRPRPGRVGVRMSLKMRIGTLLHRH